LHRSPLDRSNYGTVERSNGERARHPCCDALLGRNASASLKTLATAEADFRANDRDGNRIADYWTGDVFGRYGLVPVPAGSSALPADETTAANAIRLVQAGVAAADGASNLGAYGNVNVADSVLVGAPKAGYLYRRFATQNSGGGASTLMGDTDGSDYYGAVHDRVRFAFMAFPNDLQMGRLLFIVGGDAVVHKYNLGAAYAATYVPLTSGGDSSGTITGTGQPMLDNASEFPAAPSAIGCSKLD